MEARRGSSRPQENLYPFGREADDQEETVISRIGGAFKGWQGRTRFKLLNGQVWEQRSFACLYRFAFMPRVAIFRMEEGYQMRVEGAPGTIPVRRVG
jgi:hypothetical protein